MKKSLLAGALALAALPAVAFDASAAPITSHFTRTYTLACSIDSFVVERGKNYILVRNSTALAIPQGAKIELTILVRRLGMGYRHITRTETAYAQVTPGTGTLTFTQPYGARSCVAKVTFRRFHRS